MTRKVNGNTCYNHIVRLFCKPKYSGCTSIYLFIYLSIYLFPRVYVFPQSENWLNKLNELSLLYHSHICPRVDDPNSLPSLLCRCPLAWTANPRPLAGPLRQPWRGAKKLSRTMQWTSQGYSTRAKRYYFAFYTFAGFLIVEEFSCVHQLDHSVPFNVAAVAQLSAESQLLVRAIDYL